MALVSVGISDRHASWKLLKPFSALAYVFDDLLGLLALHGGLGRLDLENAAVGVGALASGKSIHSLLQRIILPAKEVVTVLAVSSAIDDVSAPIISASI